MVLVAAILAACTDIGRDSGDDSLVVGSGKIIGRPFEIEGFTAVHVGNTFDVEIIWSAAFSVVVSADDNIMDLVQVSRSGSRLEIGLQPGASVEDATLTARVTLPELTAVDVSGASSLVFEGFEGAERLEATISGASRLDGDVDASELRLVVSGASQAKLDGTVGELTFECSGASRGELEDLLAERAPSVIVSGASHASVFVTGSIDSVNVSGASSLTYGGSPSLGEVQTSGASTLNPR